MINNMKIYRFLFLALGILFVTSCAEDDFVGTTYPESAYENRGGALVSFTDVENGFFGFDFDNQTQVDESFVEFNVTPYGGEDVQSVDVMYTYNGKEMIQAAEVSDFNSRVRVDFSDILSATGLSEDAVKLGDLITFSLENVKTSSGTYSASNVLKAPVSCASLLAGAHPFVSTNLAAANGYDCPTGEVTGVVTFEPIGGGEYRVSDLGFGQYESTCWNDGPATSGSATIKDVCNEITSGGLDQYGLTYVWVITDVSGPELSISWSNDYGDSGNTVVTREDGTDWPPLFSK